MKSSLRSAAPEAAAAVVSKAVWNTGSVTDESGSGPIITAMQEGGTTRTVSGPRERSTSRTPSATAQPGHEAWPERNRSVIAIPPGWVPGAAERDRERRARSDHPLGRDVHAAEPGDVGKHVGAGPLVGVERGADLLGEDAAAAHRAVAVDHDHLSHRPEQVRELGRRERTEEAELHEPRGHTLVS